MDLHAQASKNTKPNQRPPKRPVVTWDRSTKPSYAVSTNTDNPCVPCKANKHPLYACTVFQALPCAKRMSLVRGNVLCLNCLRMGHIAKQCPIMQRCKKCHKSHHTWLHLDVKEEKDTKPTKPAPGSKEYPSIISTHGSQLGSSRQVLLMTCQVKVTGLDGLTTKARALLDSASSTSFITERLAQYLHLPRRHHNMRISGIGGSD